MVAVGFSSITASTLVMSLKCSQAGVFPADAVGSKGAIPELVRLVAKDIDNKGHTRVVAKSDNEQALRRHRSVIGVWAVVQQAR